MSHIDTDLGPDGPAAMQRTVRDATFRGNIVGRQVCEPLEEMHEAGNLSDAQYEALRRLRSALTGSWPRQCVTARWMGMATPSDLDEDGEPESDEDEWQRRADRHALWRAAERLLGADWPWCKGVCEGYRLGSLGRLDAVQRGAQMLVKEWRLTR
jgi:hypothetical protein